MVEGRSNVFRDVAGILIGLFGLVLAGVSRLGHYIYHPEWTEAQYIHNQWEVLVTSVVCVGFCLLFLSDWKRKREP